jgi:hypothetical protein
MGLTAPILTISSEEEICKTRTEEDNRDQTARHRASSPQVLVFINDQCKGPSDTPEQEPTSKIIAATKPFFIVNGCVGRADSVQGRLVSACARPRMV